MARFALSSLRVRLVLLVLLALLPALGLVLYTGWEQRREAAADAHTAAARLAGLAAANEERILEGARNFLAALSRLPLSHGDDPPRCSALLADFRQAYGHFTNITTVSTRGDIVCSGVPIDGPVNLADRDYFQQALQTRQFTVGDYVVGRATGKAALTLAFPVLDSAGGVKAVIGAGLDLTWLQDLAIQARLPEGSTLAMIDDGGVLLVHHPEPEKWVGRLVADTPMVQAMFAGVRSGTMEAAGVDGVRRLVAWVHVAGTGGIGHHIYVGIPSRLAFAATNRIVWETLAGLGAVTLLALAVAWVAGGVMVLRPARVLLDTAQRVGRGDLSARSGLARIRGELGQLARAFDEMATSLQARQEGAERAEHALRESAARLATLRGVEQGLLSAQSTEDIARIALHRLRQLVGARRLSLALFDSGAVEATVVALGVEGDTRLPVGTRVPLAMLSYDLDILRQGRVQVIEDLTAFSHLPVGQILYAEGVRSLFIVPLRAEEQLIGSLNFGLATSGAPRPESVEIVSEAAGSLALALHHARLYSDVTRQLREIEGLAEVSRLISQSLDPEAVGRQVVESVRTLLGTSAATLYRHDPKSGALTALAVSGALGPLSAASLVYPPGTGLVGLAVAEGRPVVSADVLTDPRLEHTPEVRARIEQATFRAAMATPLVAQGRVVGVLETGDGIGCRFDDGEMRILQMFGSQVAVALHNADLHAETERRVRELEALWQSSLTAGHLGDPGELGTGLIKALEEFLPYERASIWLRTGSEGGLALLAHSDMGVGPGALRVELTRVRGLIRLGEGISGWVALHGEPIRTGDVRSDPRYVEADPSIRSELCVPLRVGGRLIGSFNVESRQPDAFSEHDERLLATLAGQVAVALDNARLFQQSREHAIELERRVAERTAELEARNVELDTFVYSVAHDLRAPLRAMHGFAAALLEDHAASLGPVGQDYARRIMAAAGRMDRLTQDLLAYSRLSRVELVLTPVDLATVVAEAQAFLESELREREARVTIEAPLGSVRGHRATLVQVVGNLLGNAAKFVAPGVQPVVRVWAEAGDGAVRLWVEDNGVGIPPEHRERIFGVFERLHSTEVYPGTGIGLALVRKGLERMGGRVGVESEPGRGSRFWIELPGAPGVEDAR